jgi:hypothetical protein
MSNTDEPTDPTYLHFEGIYKTRRDALVMYEMILERIEKTPWMMESVTTAGLELGELYRVMKVGAKWRVKAIEKHLAATRGQYKDMGYGLR